MSLEWGLVILLLAGAVNSIVNRILDRRHEQELRRVLQVLIVWAETWGEAPETVKAKLHAVLRS